MLASGRNAYLDATFSRSEQRAAALRLGRDCGARVFCVEARCAPEVARARLARREDAGGDPSDAGPALYDRSVASFVPIAAGGGLAHVAIDTDDASWRARVASVAREIGPSRDPAPND